MATNSNKVRAINEMVAKFPLQDIIETAEVVVDYIPSPVKEAIRIVISVLKILKKLLPSANNMVNASADYMDVLEEQKANAVTKSPEREKFDNLLSIALMDGVISDQEKEFLHTKALAAGIDDDEFEMIILNYK